MVRRHAKGQPVLVGTASVKASERLSEKLTERGVAHRVLNAKEHEREAAVVAEAGRLGAVTVATNMAGRGTDILLGGNYETTPSAPRAWCTPTRDRPPRPRRSTRPTPQGGTRWGRGANPPGQSNSPFRWSKSL